MMASDLHKSFLQVLVGPFGPNFLSQSSLNVELQRGVKIRPVKRAGPFFKRKPRKQDEPTSGAMTSELLNDEKYLTSPSGCMIPSPESMSRFLCVLLCARAHAGVRPISKSPEFNRWSYPRTRRTGLSATTIHPDPIPSFYPATWD
jgi:hypothetical protein